LILELNAGQLAVVIFSIYTKIESSICPYLNGYTQQLAVTENETISIHARFGPDGNSASSYGGERYSNRNCAVCAKNHKPEFVLCPGSVRDARTFSVGFDGQRIFL
jgi:hypothetical protein